MWYVTGDETEKRLHTNEAVCHMAGMQAMQIRSPRIHMYNTVLPDLKVIWHTTVLKFRHISESLFKIISGNTVKLYESGGDFI